jgi:hypothetical protein
MEGYVVGFVIIMLTSVTFALICNYSYWGSLYAIFAYLQFSERAQFLPQALMSG